MWNGNQLWMSLDPPKDKFRAMSPCVGLTGPVARITLLGWNDRLRDWVQKVNMMLTRVIVTTAIALSSLFVSVAAGASLARRPVAITDQSEAGPEYGFQGEYVGNVSGGYRRTRVGLQIVARANHQLNAVEYRGGLPGSGWDGSEKLHSSGTWNGTVAILRGDARKIVIVNHEVWILSDGDVMRGIIKKVHRQSPTMGLLPPPGADVLFDGHSTIRLQGGRMTSTGLLQEGTETLDSVNDFRLHLEFRTPFMPAATGQGRGNSGIYIQRRYELQILDSFGEEREYNFCGSLYKTRAPDVNMCLPPLTWQTYDVWFRAARFDAKRKKIADARITVVHNGVTIHDNVPIPHKTGAGQPEGPEPLPILFQDHHNPVRFRNIWLVHEAYPTDSDRRSSLPVFESADRGVSRQSSIVLPLVSTNVAPLLSTPLGMRR